MDPRRVLNAMSNASVAFMLLVTGCDVGNAFLGNIWVRSPTPFALSSRWFIPVMPRDDGQRCFHTDCSLHAAWERKEARDSPPLVKVQSPRPVCESLRGMFPDVVFIHPMSVMTLTTIYICNTWQLFVDNVLYNTNSQLQRKRLPVVFAAIIVLRGQLAFQTL